MIRAHVAQARNSRAATARVCNEKFKLKLYNYGKVRTNFEC